MPRKRTGFDRESALFASRAARQLADLNRAMRAAEDNFSGLRRTLKVPVPSGGSRYTKSTRSAPSIFERAGITSIGSFAAGGVLSEFGFSSGSFYTSQSQMASLWSNALQQGQRVR